MDSSPPSNVPTLPANNVAPSDKPKTRVWLSDKDKLALVRLCVRYQDKYGGETKKEDFWDHIREMFLKEQGKKIL